MLEVIRGRIRPTALDFRPMLTASYQDHQAVLAALKAGDGPAAERTIRAHIRRLIKNLKKNIAAGKKKKPVDRNDTII
jgi:DNA-binding GntR family transcriptional regulator